MELLRRLLPKKIKGRTVSFAIFLCPYCLQEVEKRIGNGLKAKSCGCMSGAFISKSKKGKKHSEEHNKKISESTKGENNPMYGKIHNEETRQKIKENRGDFNGENNSMYGKKHTEEARKKNSESHKGLQSGENNPNWQGGKSFEIYPQEFNKELKQFILERDGNKCQYPGCIEVHGRLNVHHIDYDKKNNNSENLITLGTSCHTKTNGKKKRIYYIEFYQNIMMGKVMECFL